MSAGCFSWCPLLRKQTVETEVSIKSCCAISPTQILAQENQLAIIEVAAPAPVPIENISESDEVSG